MKSRGSRGRTISNGHLRRHSRVSLPRRSKKRSMYRLQSGVAAAAAATVMARRGGAKSRGIECGKRTDLLAVRLYALFVLQSGTHHFNKQVYIRIDTCTRGVRLRVHFCISPRACERVYISARGFCVHGLLCASERLAPRARGFMLSFSIF